jgi:hypothetical protein
MYGLRHGVQLMASNLLLRVLVVGASGSVVGMALAVGAAMAPIGAFADGGPPDIGPPDVSDGGVIMPDATNCSGSTANSTVCGGDGSAGCAGFGGEAGTGGQGGGAAISLYVIGNSHVTVQNGAFFLAHGGQGGQGGSGSNGASGNNGVAGGTALCYSGCDLSCNKINPSILAGGAGGAGGSGGGGGNGGGGAGGPIYYYACVDAAAPTISGTTLDASAIIEGGGPGAGGSPNGQAGASGVAAP